MALELELIESEKTENIIKSAQRYVLKYLEKFGEVEDVEYKLYITNYNETCLEVEYTLNGERKNSKLYLPFNATKERDYVTIVSISSALTSPFITVPVEQ